MSEPLDLMLVKIEAQGSLIILISRNAKGERYVVQVPFRPYFYVPAKEAAEADWGSGVSLDLGYKCAVTGEDLTKVVVSTPGDVSRKRRSKAHREGDIPYPRRFLVDTGIKKGFRLTSYRVINEEHNVLFVEDWRTIEPSDVEAPMYGYLYDIETNRDPATGKFSRPTEAKGAVTSITFNECWWVPEANEKGLVTHVAKPSEKVITLQWHASNPHFGKPTVETRWKYSHAHDKQIEWEVWTYNSEPEMHLHFLQQVKNAPPDILAAWNGHYGHKITGRRKKTAGTPKSGGTGGFDAPYLINRLDRIGIGSNQLSPLNEAVGRYLPRGPGDVSWRCEIAGVQLIDLMTTYTIKDGGMGASVPKSSLEFVITSKTDMPILKNPESIEEWWEHNNDAFLDYAFQDVDALMLLEMKEDYVGYIKRFQWHCGTEDANCLFRPSTLIDSLVLRTAKRIGVILPSADPGEQDEEVDRRGDGGYVIDPMETGFTGRRKNVVVLDVSAMYVEIMKACNIGRDTVVTEGMEERDDDIVVPLKDDWSEVARFRSPEVKLGVIPQMLDELRELRAYYDKLIKEADDPAEIKALKKQREPAKQLLLTTYGTMLSRFFRMFHEIAGRAIPAAGRFLLKSVQAFVKTLRVLMGYADTDSGFMEYPETWMKYPGVTRWLARNRSRYEAPDYAKQHEPAVAFGLWVEDHLPIVFDECAEAMRLPQHNFEMGFEKLFSVYVMGRTKKQYAGIITWAEGSYAKEPLFDMSGVLAVKHNAAPITKEAEKKVLKGILDGVEDRKLLRYVRTVYDMARTGELDIKDLVFAQRLGFDIERDKADTNIVEGAKNARDLFDYQFQVGARVYVLKTKGTKQWICVPEDKEIPLQQLKVDYEYHAEATILKPLKSIFQWIEADEEFESIAKGTKPTRQQRLTIA